MGFPMPGVLIANYFVIIGLSRLTDVGPTRALLSFHVDSLMGFAKKFAGVRAAAGQGPREAGGGGGEGGGTAAAAVAGAVIPPMQACGSGGLSRSASSRVCI